ncbi:MAG: iron-siderophore ABC transporter substrate-binding protein [Longimicrobiales bacterium]|nr:iron-siderophore ABC transporter substrate-binding protein [Longimicrobiales bacterium]
MSLARSPVRPGVLLLLAFLVGCGGGDATPAEEAASGQETVSDAGGDGTEGAPEGAPAVEGTCAPRIIDHKFGRTEIDGPPRRVVSLTSRDQDTALALGVPPMAITDGFYEEPWTASPWVRGPLGGADPEILPMGGELNYEQIAGLRPELILARGSGMTERDYDILSQIAPTVAQSGDFADFGAPWQEITRTLGRALCREERAEERIAEVEAALDEVREDHPELAGASAAVALPGGPEGSYWVYGPQDSRVRFLTTLGLELPPAIARVTGDRFAATISAERLDLVDRDVLIWMGTPEQEATVRRNPLYQRLEVARENRHAFLRFDSVLTAAWTNTSVLNIPYLIEELVPRIVSALQGSPRTTDAQPAA